MFMGTVYMGVFMCVSLCTNGGLMNFCVCEEYSEYFLQP